MRQLSKVPNKIAISLVRNKIATERRVSEALTGRFNIHNLHADMTSYDDLKQAAVDTKAEALITSSLT